MQVGFAKPREGFRPFLNLHICRSNLGIGPLGLRIILKVGGGEEWGRRQTLVNYPISVRADITVKTQHQRPAWSKKWEYNVRFRNVGHRYSASTHLSSW